MYTPVLNPERLARDLIDITREQTDAPITTCVDTVKLVVARLMESLPEDKQLCAIKIALDADDIIDDDSSYDAQALDYFMARLTEYIADMEQRSWTLQNSEESFVKMLESFSSILKKGNPKITLKRLDDLTFIGKLLTLYQIEQRARIRNAVILTLEEACSLSPNIIFYLLSSDLPVFLVLNNEFTAPLSRLEHSSLTLLGTLFSTSEKPPRSHYDYFDVDFLSKMFTLVSADDDCALEFLLNFNSHFDSHDNPVIDLLRNFDSLIFGHLLIDTFNRKRRGSDMVPLKMIADIFAAEPEIVSKTFYTNDHKVLCDILSQAILDTDALPKITLILNIYEGMLKSDPSLANVIKDALGTLLMSKELDEVHKQTAQRLMHWE